MRKTSVVVVAVIASMLLSGCWFLREAGWTRDVVKPGEQTKLRIGLAAESEPPARFFVVLIAKFPEGVAFGPAKFDSTGVLGRPKRMVRDPELLQAIADTDACEEFVPGKVFGGFLWRTNGNVGSNTRKFIEASILARVARGTETSGAGGIVVTGSWEDDGDGIPEEDTMNDELDCSGASTVLFKIRGRQPLRASTMVP